MKTYNIDEIKTLSKAHPIIAFDGICNMCNGYIQWLIKRDKEKLFRYTTLQSNEGTILKGASKVEGETLILVYKDEIFTMSDASLKSMKLLGGPWTIISWLSIVPKSLRDLVYKWVSKNRYKLFGKKDECPVPSPATRSLFL